MWCGHISQRRWPADQLGIRQTDHFSGAPQIFYRAAMIRYALALLASVLLAHSAAAEPISIDALLCDTPKQVEDFAEALLGAQLSVDEALGAINRISGEDACVFVPALVDDVKDEKGITYSNAQYVIRHVTVIALLRQTAIGLISQRVEPREQYSLALFDLGSVP